MKYIITRTSSWGEQPCKEAKKAKVITFTDCTIPKLKDALEQQEWVRRGKAVQKNGFVRVFNMNPKEVYTIEMESQEDIIKFVKKYGDIVITRSDSEDMPLKIEIYDDYRE